MDRAVVTDLVRRAAEGEQAAWRAIVEEYDGLVWGVARGYRLGEAQTADAVQTTWLKLVEHLAEIREPDRLAGWLVTTTRRACLATQRLDHREQLTDFCESRLGTAGDVHSTSADAGPEAVALRRDHRVLVRQAVATLPERHQALLGLLSCAEPASYEEISTGLGMPVGSIGPTRARILARLRVVLGSAGLQDMALN
jgi:RNA polymerase sigma factor (sigma-70 family)